MTFGIWPGVIDADLVELKPLSCPPEDPGATLAALKELQGAAPHFYVRCYRHFGNKWSRTPERPGLYAGEGRLIDLVACYQGREPEPDGFADFVRQAVRDVAAWGGGKVQVGEELNVPAPLDGGSPGCFEAVGADVAATFDECERLGADVGIGVNSAGPADPAFWRQLASAIGPDHLARLDFVGLDLFPDVFRRIPHDRLAAAVTLLLKGFRSVTTDVGVLSATPIHITETGWPTGGDRAEATQRVVLETVAQSILDSDVGVAAYELFGLRDSRSDAGWASGFGLLRDDYSPKPAFPAVRDFIRRTIRPKGGGASAVQPK
ncbi:hypothetical protein AB0F91_20470 [Amycolatopsis sp. NPDC023774]|uniref:hypothetical protein n=1 Tax=Amycolatopsis sp. NPDC023774 TaxID=3155015 RepID=UPI0033CBFBF6